MDNGLKQIWASQPDLEILKSFQRYREAKIALDQRFAEFLQLVNDLIYNTTSISDVNTFTIIGGDNDFPTIKDEVDDILKKDLALSPISPPDKDV